MKTKKKADGERPADLTFWLKDGFISGSSVEDSGPQDTEISIGRTNSKRALGFVVIRKGMDSVDFVLNKAQVADLVKFLQFQLPRLQPTKLKPQSQGIFDALFDNDRKS
jgi:hypothetical protein